jgi:uncharacterized protein (DUF58 family)
MNADNSPLLLEDAIRRKLDPLMLVARKVRAGVMKGDRRSTKHGTSIEFADYRNYTQGDDLRRLDWNVYARTERPYIKLLEDEEDLAVHVLMDASMSMDWPKESDNDTSEAHHKLLYAKRLMAGLAYVALSVNDRLMLSALRGVGENATFGPARGRAQTVPMLRYAHGLSSGGVVNLSASLKAYASRASRAGLCFIISDLFSADGYIDGLNALIGRGHEVILLHTLAPDEVTPPLAGDLRLLDVETGQAQEVSIDAGMRTLYMQRVTAWRDEIRAECTKRGIVYVPIVTDTAWEKVLLYDLRRLGVVR